MREHRTMNAPKVTVSRHTNTPGMEWSAKLSDGKGGSVSYVGSTPELALAKLSANHDIEGLPVTIKDGELKPVVASTSGIGRYKKDSYASQQPESRDDRMRREMVERFGKAPVEAF